MIRTVISLDKESKKWLDQRHGRKHFRGSADALRLENIAKRKGVKPSE
jgi:hypothetical protein